MCFSMGNENYRCVSSAKSFTLGCCVGGVLKRCYFLLVDHCVKSVKIRSYFWSIFSCIWTEYGDLQSNRKYGPEITPHFHADFSRSGRWYFHWFLAFKEQLKMTRQCLLAQVYKCIRKTLQYTSNIPNVYTKLK